MHAILVGLNHKSAAVELREKLHFDDKVIKRALRNLSRREQVEECAILSTCNRVELYASSLDVNKGLGSLKNFLAEYHEINEAEIDPHLYELSAEAAVTHLFRVAASLDSLVVGENQILGQVKSAYLTAQGEGCTKHILNRLFQSAISIGKKVRTETAIGAGSVSVGSTAVDLLKEIFPQNYPFKVCLLGAGKISELTAHRLEQYGRIEFTVVNRHFQKALTLAKRFGGRAGKFEDRYHHVLTADVSIISTSGKLVLEKESFAKHLRLVKGSKMRFLVDLSVPRSVDPLIQSIDDTVLYSIDDLEKIVRQNENKRHGEIQSSEQLVRGGVNEFFTWYYQRQIRAQLQSLGHKYQLLLKKNYAGKRRPAAEGGLDDLIAEQKMWQALMTEIITKVQSPGELKEIMSLLKNVNPKRFTQSH